MAKRNLISVSAMLGLIALVTGGVPTAGLAENRPKQRMNDLRPCLSVYHYSPSHAESEWTARERLGAGEYSPERGEPILEALVFEAEAWGVSVYLPGDGAANVMLRLDAGGSTVDERQRERSHSVRTYTTTLPRELARRINDLWRLRLSEARVDLATLPPPGHGVIGGCVDGTAYTFMYLGACAIPTTCGAGGDSTSGELINLVHSLRRLAIATDEENRDAEYEALRALVTRCESSPNAD